MGLYTKIILILFGLAYLISPVDLIPDLLVPFFGWLDDGVVIISIYHLIRYGQLPWFLFKKPGIKARPGENKKASAKPSFSSKPKGESPRDILGVSPHASWAQIQEAYREKIKQYHPDKLSHLGEEFSTLANEKFLKIQKAYDTLKKESRQ